LAFFRQLRGADSTSREQATKTIADYETLAALAAIVPRMRAMREYLAAPGLHASNEIPARRDPAIVALETESQLLAVETGPRALTALPGTVDALEARFQNFKWT
jgi:hypothetical protein